MKPEEYIGHSGGALGSDFEWDIIGRKYGITKFNHYYFGTKTPLGNSLITKEQLDEGWQAILIANLILKRYGIVKYKNLLSRNYWQSKNSQAVYAISSIEDKTISGGTAWSIICSVIDSKPAYLFDQNQDKWFEVSKHEKLSELIFKETEVPKLTQNFASIGTREINDKGKAAINAVYVKTFGELNETV